MMNFSGAVIFLIFLHLSVSLARRQVYIVRIGENHSSKRTLAEIEKDQFSYLTSVKNSEVEAKSSLLYSYKNIMNGFSALLTPEEADKLYGMDGVVSVIKSEPIRYRPQTTRSWEFTNLLGKGNNNVDEASNQGKDSIIGLIDTGIWPESESFNDEGMEPVPKSWKGICQQGTSFNSSHCNRKIIGARYYLKGYEARFGRLNETVDFRSPRDKDGHGTHTASTAAGRRVPNASLLGGFSSGTARGGATLARLAIYKACWVVPGTNPDFVSESTCFGEDTLAAFDDAVADGVHVISISIASNELSWEDGILIGAFEAAKRDIVVAASGGNGGPAAATVRNVAPWMISVGASTIDRVFSSPLLLGNGIKIQGQTATPYTLSKMQPIVYAGDVEIPGKTNNQTSGLCSPGTLKQELVRGKIVYCLVGDSRNVEKGLEVKRAGGVGVILENPLEGIQVSVDTQLIPATTINYNDSETALNYIKGNMNAKAQIVPVRTVIGSKPSPFMAGFSSSGPNLLAPNLLKPDITAPGVNIVAAWSEATSVTKLAPDHRVVKYNVLSGTSMSCPHVAAAAALIKSAHPDWSSAAVRSAIMTTATQTNNLGQPITDSGGSAAATPFLYGSGHFQPAKAINPGLVYDANYTDYLLYLCNINSSVPSIFSPFKCPKHVLSPSDLNYPSVAVSKINAAGVSVRRTVTNVCREASFYRVSVEAPPGYTVDISPATMNFSGPGQKQSFQISIKSKGGRRNDHAFGWYTWTDGVHNVKSPIVVSP